MVLFLFYFEIRPYPGQTNSEKKGRRSASGRHEKSYTLIHSVVYVSLWMVDQSVNPWTRNWHKLVSSRRPSRNVSLASCRQTQSSSRMGWLRSNLLDSFSPAIVNAFVRRTIGGLSLLMKGFAVTRHCTS